MKRMHVLRSAICALASWVVALSQAAEPALPAAVKAPSGQAPSDATVLFDGRNLKAWEAPQSPDALKWTMNEAALVATPGAGNLTTRASFGNVQLHLEFRTPTPPEGRGIARGNSGVLFMERYELQIHDSYDNPVEPERLVGAIYNQVPPLVNASRPPGQWQTLDVLFYAPRRHGKNVIPAHMTVFLNDILVQHDTLLRGQTSDDQEAIFYEPHDAELPLSLQETGSPVAFRNIWVRAIALPDSNAGDER